MDDLRYLARFAVTALATWRLTHLLAREDGPADILIHLRKRLGESKAGQLMDCFQCLSIWIAAPATLLVARRTRDLAPTWLALSGAACLLEKLGQEPVVIQPGIREGETNNVLLRSQTGNAPERDTR